MTSCDTQQRGHVSETTTEGTSQKITYDMLPLQESSKREALNHRLIWYTRHSSSWGEGRARRGLLLIYLQFASIITTTFLELTTCRPFNKAYHVRDLTRALRVRPLFSDEDPDRLIQSPWSKPLHQAAYVIV